jgi:hypothetical protein
MLVFEKVDDLVECLETILKDEQVVVERIKNRLDEEHDAAASSGYRSAEYVCVYACACICTYIPGRRTWSRCWKDTR